MMPPLSGEHLTLDEALALLDAYKLRAARGQADVRRYAGSAQGQPVFCLGTGPSLLTEDASGLEGCHVVCTNHAHRFLRGTRVASRWHVVTDNTRAGELLGELEAEPGPTFTAPNRLTPEWMALAARHPGVHVLWSRQWLAPRHRGGWDVEPHVTPFSSLDLGEHLDHAGYSVIFAAIQLATFIGAGAIVLLGVDMDYSGPQTHFEGRVSHTNPGFDYETHARPAFVWFRRALESRGVVLLNATRGGRVDVLPRTTLAAAVALARVCAAARPVRPGEARAAANLAPKLWEAMPLSSRPAGPRPVLVWGAGAGGRRVLAAIRRAGLEPSAIVDADAAKAGRRLDGVEVVGPTALERREWRGGLVLVASIHHLQIEDWLYARGWASDAVFVLDPTALPAGGPPAQTAGRVGAP